MPTIPISTLPSPPRDTRLRLGHVFAHDVTIPVIVTTSPGKVTIDKNRYADNLGEWLKDISQVLTKEQVEDLVKGIEVQL